MPKFASLGDRMKFYEQLSKGCEHLMPLVPVIVRLDGKAFHTFTKDLKRPYDANLIDLMVATTKALVAETQACVGYTQSDEITLVLYKDRYDSQVYFDGVRDKINTILASKCSSYFTSKLGEYLPGKVGELPVFDCRCFSVPTRAEASVT